MKRILMVCTLVFTLMISPCFAIQYCKDILEPGNPGGWSSSLKTFDDEWTMGVGSEVDLDIWINDVPKNLIATGFWIAYDPSKVSIVSVNGYDNSVLLGPWELTDKLQDPGGPGTYRLLVLDFSGQQPDGGGDIIIAKVRFRCESEGDAIITISTVPGMNTTVDIDGTVYDGQITPNVITIHQSNDPLTTTTTTIADICEGDFDEDRDQDGSDAALFKTDFGRNQYNRPCPPETTTTTISGGCPYGMVDCGDKCVDPLTDGEHCGADINCNGGTVCGAGQICAGGVCVLSCQSGLTNCSGMCVDTQTNENHCGGCTGTCVSGEVCIGGNCEVYCSDNYAPVPKTGQTTCYDMNGNVIACAGTGQDGELQKGVPWPNPRFTNNGNGTVTDNLTGLIWLRNTKCGDCVGVFGQLYVWIEALNFASAMENGECGLTDGSVSGDWRLPNKWELLSLINEGDVGEALPPGHPFILSDTSSLYWTSSSMDQCPEYAHKFDMEYTGFIYPYQCGHGTYHKMSAGCVWPVRGGQ